MTFEMPKRTDVDGAVGVHRMVGTAPPHEDRGLSIEVTHEGKRQTVAMSRYNAARILVMLCTMLEVPHPKPLGKLPM